MHHAHMINFYLPKLRLVCYFTFRSNATSFRFIFQKKLPKKVLKKLTHIEVQQSRMWSSLNFKSKLTFSTVEIKSLVQNYTLQNHLDAWLFICEAANFMEP